MRSYNFVVLTPKQAEQTFIIKAIDFDQQCYEGKMNLYLPQFYKENYPYVKLCQLILSDAAIEKIRQDERKQLTLIAKNNKERYNNKQHKILFALIQSG